MHSLAYLLKNAACSVDLKPPDPYWPPEGVLSSRADTWALGILLLEWLQGPAPVEDAKEVHQKLQKSTGSAITLLRCSEDSLSPASEKYSRWLSAPSVKAGVMLDFLNHCLQIDPSDRHVPKDIRGHPFLTHAADHRAIDMLQPSSSDVAEFLRRCGISLNDVFYWWRLRGGDVFQEAVRSGAIRPAPPLFRLPLCEFDCGTPQQKTMYASYLPPLASKRTVPPIVPLSIDGLVSALRRVTTEYSQLCADDILACQHLDLVERQLSFDYQWQRFLLFQELLSRLPKSRPRLVEEARNDIPASLRPRLWAAFLGIFPEVSARVHIRLYQGLITSGALRNDMENEKVARVLMAVVENNPRWALADGLDDAAPVVEVLAELWPLPDEEVVIFLIFQSIVQSLLLPFYNDSLEGAQSVLWFLVRYVDPELSVHLENINFTPPMWARTLFAPHLPRPLLFILWDQLLLEPPQYSLFVAVAILHHLREGMLKITEASRAASFLKGMLTVLDLSRVLLISKRLLNHCPMLLATVNPAKQYVVDETKSVESDEDKQERRPEVRRREDAIMESPAAEPSRWWEVSQPEEKTCASIQVHDLIQHAHNVLAIDVRSAQAFAETHFIGLCDLDSSIHIENFHEQCLRRNIMPTQESWWGQEKEPNPQIVCIIGDSKNRGDALANTLIQKRVVHVVTLLGGIDAVKFDAPSFLGI
eukprot:GEMP01014570.1.p1 GENE.GEMP01014570.1~~GEMP01014570.1.p1  ORF type:complete len:702 (+),score=165.25 GEMP01014570.1:372-2477(+)